MVHIKNGDFTMFLAYMSAKNGLFSLWSVRLHYRILLCISEGAGINGANKTIKN